MDKELRDLLYAMPPNADYASDLSELDEEDIPKERIPKLRQLLCHPDDAVAFDAARVLCGWTDEEGFEYLTQFVCDRQPVNEGWFPHRLRGYDDTYRMALLALKMYWAGCADAGRGEEARRKIFRPISKIIELSGEMPFAIDYFFHFVEEKKFTEYLPALKTHLQAILKHPELHHWKIADCAHLLMKFDPEFVQTTLATHGKTLADFPLGY